MELPDPFLPGAISLLDQLDKRLMVMLRDGKTLIGDLRTIDQFANLVLHNTLERIYVDGCYGDIPRGMFMIRGENVILAGELTDENPKELTKVRLQFICWRLDHYVVKDNLKWKQNILSHFFYVTFLSRYPWRRSFECNMPNKSLGKNGTNPKGK